MTRLPSAQDEREPTYCLRCGDERDQDPADRPADPALDYAREKCVGEGGHIWPMDGDA